MASNVGQTERDRKYLPCREKGSDTSYSYTEHGTPPEVFHFFEASNYTHG